MKENCNLKPLKLRIMRPKPSEAKIVSESKVNDASKVDSNVKSNYNVNEEEKVIRNSLVEKQEEKPEIAKVFKEVKANFILNNDIKVVEKVVKIEEKIEIKYKHKNLKNDKFYDKNKTGRNNKIKPFDENKVKAKIKKPSEIETKPLYFYNFSVNDDHKLLQNNKLVIMNDSTLVNKN